MTIAKRIVISSTVLGLGLLIAGAAVVTAFLALQRLAASTHEEFHEVCDLREISAHVTAAERFLAMGERASTDTELQKSLEQLSNYNRYQNEAPTQFDAKHAGDEEDAGNRILSALSEARAVVASGETAVSSDLKIRAALEQASDILNDVTARSEQAIADVHSQTAVRFEGTLWFLVIIEITSLASTVVFSLLLYRNVVTPLRNLRDGTDRLAEGKLQTRLKATGDREFVELQDAFNRMATELESHCKNLEKRVAEKGRELAIAERLASVGYLAAGVAHEINNPLAIMSGYAESLLRTAGNEPSAEYSKDWIRDLETIRDEAFRCKRITQSLLDLSRLGDDHRAPVSLAETVSSCARLIAAWPASRGVTFDIQPSARNGSMVLASEPELKQVLLNLLANAVEASTPTQGTVTVAMEQNNGWVDVVVKDNGRGMTPDTLARIFEPFFTTGKPRVGLGLGLSISHAIARRHGGTLEASSLGPGCGTTLVLRLPALKEKSQ